MRSRVLRYLSVLALVVTFAPSATLTAEADAAEQQQEVVRRPIPRDARGRTFDFARTELYFGTAKPQGLVTEEEFQDFVDREVTPRFPNGFTVLQAGGQFLGADGVIVTEDAYLLILLYPTDRVRQSNTRIETLRRLYKQEFQQESVLSVDDLYISRVSF